MLSDARAGQVLSASCNLQSCSCWVSLLFSSINPPLFTPVALSSQTVCSCIDHSSQLCLKSLHEASHDDDIWLMLQTMLALQVIPITRQSSFSRQP